MVQEFIAVDGVECRQMVKFDIPPKEDERKQLVASVVVLLIVTTVLIILGKMIAGLVIFLLGAAFGVGAKVISTNPLDKDK